MHYEVFLNGQPYAGILQLKVKTEPEIPAEDWMFGRYDPAVVKVTEQFFLVPNEGEPIQLLKGTAEFKHFPLFPQDDLGNFDLPEIIGTIHITTPL